MKAERFDAYEEGTMRGTISLVAILAAMLLALPAGAEPNFDRASQAGPFQVGTGSWYGPGFHGKVTANGEIFDQNKLTAAHRTLPLPSTIAVTNLANNRSLILRVNDRGPYIEGRIVDVSKRAAQILGFEKEGLATLQLEVLD